MGHTPEVHDVHYKNVSGYIERINLGKLFMMRDANCTAAFQGMKLKDIDIKGWFYIIIMLGPTLVLLWFAVTVLCRRRPWASDQGLWACFGAAN